MVEPGMHVTNFGTRANIEGCIAQAWDKADPSVKEEYGDEYYQHS